MDCSDVRDRLLAHQRGHLEPSAKADVDEHLRLCAACRQAATLDAQLSDLLARELPRHAAPPELRRLLAERVGGTEASRPRRRFVAPLFSALASAAAALLVVAVTKPAFLRPGL